MLLANLIEETHNNIQDLKAMLKGIKTPQELADILLTLSNQNESVVSESSLSRNVLKWSLPVLLTMFTPDFVAQAVDLAKNKTVVSTKQKSEKQQVEHWLKVYTKKYKIDYNVMCRIMEKENTFISKSHKRYDANTVGDKKSSTGPSYGAGQIKVSTAQDIYKKYPESDVNVFDITPAKLRDDIKFNVRTSCKLVSSYFYNNFKNIKSNKTRYELAATAYNSGITITRKTKRISPYGKFVAANTK